MPQSLVPVVTYQPQTPFGTQLFDALEPWQTDALGYWCDAIGTAVEPLRALIQDRGVDGDTDYLPGWGSLTSVVDCPTEDLPYLAQLVGVTLPVGADDPTARQLILAESGKDRGTFASIQSAVTRSISTPWTPLTSYLADGPLVSFGTPPDYYNVATNFTSGVAFDATHLTLISIGDYFQVLERYNGVTGQENQAYQLTIVVAPETLTPASDDTQLLANVLSVKPAGIILTVIQSDLALLSQYVRNMSAVTVELRLAALADVV